MLDLDTIHHGDCLDLMQHIPTGSVDMILCDLPYGTTKNKWDAVIPFDKLWAQYKRIIKPNGAIVLTAAQPFTAYLILSNPANFKYCWYWVKNRSTGIFNAKSQPLRNVEEICVFSARGYNPQGLKPYGKPSRNGKNISANYNPSKVTEYIREYTNYPKQVLEFDSVQRVEHPTQKPVALFEYLIRTYTNEGEVVLDNCAGSCTTAIAALNANRRFICIEQEEKYVAIGRRRVAERQPALHLV